MARHHQFDCRAAERFDDIEIFFPGDPKDLLYSLVFECRNEQVGAVHPVSPLNRTWLKATGDRPGEFASRCAPAQIPGSDIVLVDRTVDRGTQTLRLLWPSHMFQHQPSGQ
jgi:hypothetical protein